MPSYLMDTDNGSSMVIETIPNLVPGKFKSAVGCSKHSKAQNYVGNGC